jgi:hypothetical protein
MMLVACFEDSASAAAAARMCGGIYRPVGAAESDVAAGVVRTGYGQ